MDVDRKMVADPLRWPGSPSAKQRRMEWRDQHFKETRTAPSSSFQLYGTNRLQSAPHLQPPPPSRFDCFFHLHFVHSVRAPAPPAALALILLLLPLTPATTPREVVIVVAAVEAVPAPPYQSKRRRRLPRPAAAVAVPAIPRVAVVVSPILSVVDQLGGPRPAPLPAEVEGVGLVTVVVGRGLPVVGVGGRADCCRAAVVSAAAAAAVCSFRGPAAAVLLAAALTGFFLVALGAAAPALSLVAAINI